MMDTPNESVKQTVLDIFRPGKNRLGKRILFYMLAVSSLFTGLISGFQIFTEYRRDLDLLESKVRNAIKANEETLGMSMWTLNLELVNSVFRGIVLDPDFRYLAIKKKDTEEPTVQYGTPLNENHLERTIQLKYRQGESDVDLETWIIHASLERVTGNVMKRGAMILVSQGLKTFAVSFIILLLINMLFTRHLLSIVNYLKTVNFTKSFDKLKLNRSGKNTDEIDIVVENINSMGMRLYGTYETLTNFSNTLEILTVQRTKQFEQKSRDVQVILNNIQQGIFTIDDERKIQSEYSAYMKEIFASEAIAERDAIDFLFQKSDVTKGQSDQVKSILLNSIGDEILNYTVNRHLFPNEFVRTTKTGDKKLELTWQPITDEHSEIMEKMMVVVRDVTELYRLRSETEAKDRELALVGQILQGTIDGFEKFSQSLLGALEYLHSLLKGEKADATAVGELLRTLHTFKGNGSMLGYKLLASGLHDLEHNIIELRDEHPEGVDTKVIRERLVQVRALWDQYLIIFARKFARSGKSEKDEMFDACQQLAKKVQDPLQLKDQIFATVLEFLQRSEFSKLGDVVLSLQGPLERMALDLGKEAPRLQVQPSNLLLLNSRREFVIGIFNHLLRNSTDHGLEPADERIHIHKPANGTIAVAGFREGEQAIIRFSDDGRGLNLTALSAKGKGLISPSATDEEIAELIFVAGLSTAAAVTDISGRGVGMDAVRDFLRRNGGDIKVQFTGPRTESGFRAFAFYLYLPLEGFFFENHTETA